jgi:hypothetical protein
MGCEGRVLSIKASSVYVPTLIKNSGIIIMKKMTTTTVLENILAEYGVKTIYYFDRLGIYFDAYSREENLGKLLDDSPKNKFFWQPLPHNDFFDRKIELFQPSAECLKNLTDPQIVGGDCAINYAEFAVDFITDELQIKEKLFAFFNRHLVRIPSRQSKASPYCNDDFDEATYLSPKGDKESLLFYSDEPARTEDDQLCLHVEFRVKGWAQVKKQKILTISDLIEFDHQQLWDNQLDLRRPNLSELGVVCLDGETSRNADYKRGVKEWQAIETLQKYLSLHPERESAFVKITPENLGKCLGDFMKDPD